MKYHYEPGAKRWSKHNNQRDVRLCAPPNGWGRRAYQLEHHPITGKPFRTVQWWFLDIYTGDDE